MSIRELIVNYILFAFTEQELVDQFQITPAELESISDPDLLDIYDRTIVSA